ncbi:lysophospholipid acyltransferase family protein [Bdellovibrio sp. HCB2-146]|uniref:lysophospholipid acyltransferase family protein n=1 Tax=Bdellovibrio sp. HCB2-146 TaxID=3394362 RepID=UPI0039BD0818
MKLLVNFFVQLFSFISKFLPRPLLRFTGLWAGVLWFDVFRFRRKIVLDNLTIAFPEWDEQKKVQVGRQSLYNMSYNFPELFAIPHMDQAWLDKYAVFEGWENVEKARAAGKGVFFLTLHLGNGDVAANAIEMKGQPIYMITKRFKTKWFDDLWFAMRGAKGVKYIDAHGTNNAFEILKALKKNGAVVFVLDQFMGRPFGIETTFFGKKTGTAYGLALFVQKTKAPVIPIYTYEGNDGKLHIVTEPEMDLSSYLSEDKDQAILQITQAFNNKLETIIRKYPEQWMWVHRRWKDFR